MNETARQARQRRQREAQERQAAYDALSLDEKFIRALKRGHSRTREVARLRQERKVQA